MRPRRSLFFVAPATPAPSTSCKPPAPATRPLCFSRCIPASCGAAWGGYGAAWAGPPSPAPATRPVGFHESCITAFIAVRFTVDAKGSHNRKPPSGPPCPPPGHGFPVQDCSPLFTINLNGGGAEQVSAHRQPFSVGLPASAVSPQLPPLSLDCANRGTFSVALTARLLFSQHGEAKCVRGPSGRGASRAEEEGARRST